MMNQSMKRFLIGLIVLVLISVVSILVLNATNQEEESQATGAITIVCATGGGKENFLADPEINQILAEEYGISVEHISWSNGKISDQALAADKSNTYDAVFFSDQRFYEQYLAASNQTYKKAKGYIALNTPIVFYSWKPVVEVLMGAGIVTARDDVYYLSDMDMLLAYMDEGVRWCDVAPEQSLIHANKNPINVIGVDPITSSPGATYMGLLAGIIDPMNKTGKITDETIQRLQKIYRESGFLGGTPSDLFSQYLRIGAGTYPLIVDYEKSLIDWAVAHPNEYTAQIKDNAVILYPEPTVWNSHCIISFSKEGSILVDALENNERIHEIAFNKYGFRMGLSAKNVSAFQTDEGEISFTGIPSQLYSTIPGLRMEGYNRIVEALQSTLAEELQ